MRVMVLIILIGIFGLGGYVVFSIRTVTHDPDRWHVDPLTAPAQPTPNGYYVGPPSVSTQPVNEPSRIYDADAARLAAAFDGFVMGQPRVERLAGSIEEAWITYVQRTETLQFPDYISVRFFNLDVPNTSTVAIFSRSRFGHSDMGVNEDRVQSWLKSIASLENGLAAAEDEPEPDQDGTAPEAAETAGQ